MDQSIDRRMSKEDRAIFHPPEQSFGTVAGEVRGEEMAKGIGMGQPGDSSSSDSESDDEEEEESAEESDAQEDIAEQLDEYFNKTPQPAEAKVVAAPEVQQPAVTATRKTTLPLPGFMRRGTAASKSSLLLVPPRHPISKSILVLTSHRPYPLLYLREQRLLRRKRRGSSSSPGGRRRQKSRKSRDGAYTFQSGGADDVLGLVFLEIKGADDLPRYKNMTRTGFDMDPFVIISFGQKVFRTRRAESKYQICYNIFDWDKLTSNDSIGETKLDLSELLSIASKPSLETGLFPVKGDSLVGDDFKEFTLPITIKSDMEKSSPKLKIRAKFTPYEALRQQFWRQWIKQYDIDNSGTISYVELFSMLDALGSTLSKNTITTFFTRFGKSESDSLTVDELIICLEEQIAKPNNEKRPVDNDAFESGLQTPDVNNPGGFGQVTGSPEFERQQLDYVGEQLRNASAVEELKASNATDTSASLRPLNAGEEIVNAATGETLKAPPNQPHLRQDSTSSSTSNEGLSSSADEADDSVERVINIKFCPLCQKPRLNSKAELDIVTHLAICASQDWKTVDKIMVGNFVTASQAHRKWFTKVISKVSSGSYRLGANNANIIVQDRRTGQLLEEKMQVYVRLGIRLLYKGLGSNRMEGARIRNMLESMSFKQGIKYDDPESAKGIEAFIAFHNLDMNEVLDPLPSFKTFNEFFYRKLKPDARPVDEPDNPNILVSGADCRCMVFPTINDATNLWIKGREFSLGRLFGDKFKDGLSKYEGGALVIFRLAPQDYHRYHSPVDGVIGPQVKIAGQYYTVNPMAIRSAIDVYGENVRLVMPIQSPQFGQVMVCHIGAMLVGSICMTAKEGDHIKRGDETGYFAFGGSTIVIVFEKNTVQFDQDLIDNSKQCIETLVRVGMKIGRRI
ncbi:hypothetical protein BT69DRAFT_948032 [Atractiella rhizophila]|nr:hypothetical protein BT69DRAFT_948032 [Atractiella rhizophila]